ncbi:hypothetical protein OCD79_00175 [Bacillus wiedmannii]|uniref:Uncharacterized protein n=1 Tax=Bacillus cereus TaxID=1396 RepID=A0A9W7Q7U8_BACCE|nr:MULTISPECIES: hypothetical protein [Bacillus cereus group]KAA6471604.1 hypothetical protein DX932_04600 [Bacillus cereus]KAB2502891.1 hypothetical protein F8156_18695 [Bacillus cereus]MCU5110010.1 hypothetical protein [Bacillus wiedmannii]MCU5149684.1 hypothetical protein [Bacillus wiedmannii]HEF5706559.1 hypothetical protein [Bacillus cereus]
MTGRRRGRPKAEYPVHIIQNIIYRYSKEKKIKGKIQYMEVYRFSQELFQKGEIEYNMKEFFWRKGTGREHIDKANEVLTHSIAGNTQEDEIIINTEDAINKFFTGKQADKNKLIGTLKINENKLKKYIQKCKILEKQLSEAKGAITEQKEKIKHSQNKIDTYEETLFQWLELSNNKNIPLYNLMTTGKTRTPFAHELLRFIFSENPIEIFNQLNTIQTQIIGETTLKQNDTVSLNKQRKRETNVLDDINF